MNSATEYRMILVLHLHLTSLRSNVVIIIIVINFFKVGNSYGYKSANSIL